MKINKKLILLIILTFLISVFLTYLFLEKKEINLKSTSNSDISNSSEIVIGKPCSYNGSSELIDTKGLQCYFYGDTDSQKGIRSGIWIKPDIRYRSLGSYSDYFSAWKKYESPDHKISFNYHSSWAVNESNLKDNVISIGAGQPFEPFIYIEKVAKNSISMNDRIQSIKDENSTVLVGAVSLSGSNFIRLDVAPTSNIFTESTYLLIDKGDYYLIVTAPKYNDPLFDFPIEYFLSTFSLKE